VSHPMGQMGHFLLWISAVFRKEITKGNNYDFNSSIQRYSVLWEICSSLAAAVLLPPHFLRVFFIRAFLSSGVPPASFELQPPEGPAALPSLILAGRSSTLRIPLPPAFFDSPLVILISFLTFSKSCLGSMI